MTFVTAVVFPLVEVVSTAGDVGAEVEDDAPIIVDPEIVEVSEAVDVIISFFGEVDLSVVDVDPELSDVVSAAVV